MSNEMPKPWRRKATDDNAIETGAYPFNGLTPEEMTASAARQGIKRTPDDVRAERRLILAEVRPTMVEALASVGPLTSTDVAERQVIGRALLYPECAAEMIAELEADDFDGAMTRAAFMAMGLLWNLEAKSTEWPQVMPLGLAMDRVGCGISVDMACEFLVTCSGEVASPSNMAFYVRLVKERSRKRRLDKAGDRLRDMSKQHGPADSIVSEAMGDLLAVQLDTGGAENFGDASAAVYTALERPNGDEVSHHPTGIPSLDKQLMGGLRPGQLIVIAGRPSSGKSALGQQIAEHIALRSGPVVVFSLEMQIEEYVHRGMTANSGVAAWKMRNRRMGADDWAPLADAVRKFEGVPLTVIDRPRMSIDDIRAESLRIRLRGPIGLIVVDYLQLVRGERGVRHLSREQEVSSISRTLKEIAKEVGAPVIALAQLNREVDKRPGNEPQLSDLRESGAIEADSDIVAFVHRDYLYKPEEADPREAYLFVRKHRNGGLFKLRLDFDPPTTRFLDAS